MTASPPSSLLDWAPVERATMANGSEFVLARHGDDWVVRVGNRVLMCNTMHHSEEELAVEAIARATHPGAVLVGGLGLGYTLRAVLDRVSDTAEVTRCGASARACPLEPDVPRAPCR